MRCEAKALDHDRVPKRLEDLIRKKKKYCSRIKSSSFGEIAWETSRIVPMQTLIRKLPAGASVSVSARETNADGPYSMF